MKKYLMAMLMAIVLVSIAATAFAEETATTDGIVLLDGVRMGSTIEEAVAQGNLIKVDDFTYKTEKQRIAAQDNAYITYTFSEVNGKVILTQARYTFPMFKEYSPALEYWGALAEALVNKYTSSGSNIYSNKSWSGNIRVHRNEYFVVEGPVRRQTKSGGNQNYLEIPEAFTSAEYSIKIELYQYDYTFVGLCYFIYTPADVEAAEDASFFNGI